MISDTVHEECAQLPQQTKRLALAAVENSEGVTNYVRKSSLWPDYRALKSWIFYFKILFPRNEVLTLHYKLHFSCLLFLLGKLPMLNQIILYIEF